MQIVVNKYGEIIAFASDGTYTKGIAVEIPNNVLVDNPLSYKYTEKSLYKKQQHITSGVKYHRFCYAKMNGMILL